jgi:hypothetical protein
MWGSYESRASADAMKPQYSTITERMWVGEGIINTPDGS